MGFPYGVLRLPEGITMGVWIFVSFSGSALGFNFSDAFAATINLKRQQQKHTSNREATRNSIWILLSLGFA